MLRQDWMAGINSSERFIQYRKFKLVLEPVSYTHLTLPTMPDV